MQEKPMHVEELVAKLKTAESTISEYGGQRLSLVTQYYSTLDDFISRLEKSIEKNKRLMNADLSVKRKHAMKQHKLLKKMTQFFREMDQSYKNGEIQDKEGKIFARAYKKAANGNFAEAKELLFGISGMAAAYTEFVRLNKLAEEQKKKLAQRKAAIHASIEKASSAVPVDEGYMKKHKMVIQGLGQAKELRTKYIQRLDNKSIMDYVKMLENKELIMAGFPSTDPASLVGFLAAYPELSSLTPGKLLEYCSWTDGKLKHTIPETSKFRSIMGKYSLWFGSIKNLESSKFMAIENASDAKKLAILFKNTEMGGLLSRLSELTGYWAEPPKSAQAVDVKHLERELSGISQELAVLNGA